jgi:hypothetical protein
MYTNRLRGLTRLIDILIRLGLASGLAYLTFFFGWPAFRELWSHGYSSGVTNVERPEFNLITRFFFTADSRLVPDLARVDFNLFLRIITVSIGFFVSLCAPGFVVEGIVNEHSRETWSSLVATPLSGADILRAKLLSSVWRMREVLGVLVVLWSLGLISGAIHPLGFVLTLLSLVSSTWFFMAWAVRGALRAKGLPNATNSSLFLVLFLICSGFLPFLLPIKLNSVLLGVCSPQYVSWMAQLSYRDVRNLLYYPAYPHLQWIGIDTGEGAIAIAATCLVGVLLPAVAGLLVWRGVLAQFDRLIGRPWSEEERKAEAAFEGVAPEPVGLT